MKFNITNYLRKRFLSIKAFTLLEVLLVAVIVAIIVTIATPRFRHTLTTIQLENTTQDIAQTMRFLKVKAAAEKSIYQLRIDLDKRVYLVQKLGGGAVSSFSKPRAIPNDISIAATINPINFYPNGSIDKAVIYLYRGEEKYNKDLTTAINKEFDLGQIQTIAKTEYVYSITTIPLIGKVKVTVPEH